MKTFVTYWIGLLCFLTNGNCQTVYYQDVFYGGITADGFSVGTGNGVGQINVSIPNGAIIKKGFLFCGRHGIADDLILNFNGSPLLLDESSVVSNFFQSPVYGGEDGGYVHAIDVTNSIVSSINTYSISIPYQGIHGNRYVDFYLIVLYENTTTDQVAITVLINSDDIGKYINYDFNNLLPINTSNDVGLAIHGGYMCDTLIEPTLIYVENNYLGKLGGNDLGNINECAGVVGSFEYLNSTLFGLNDDNPDFEVRGSDALSNVSSILPLGLTSFNVLFEAVSINNQENKTNPVWSISLSYTTPCAPFSVTVPNDTTICQGSALQLNVSGGQSYEWLSPTNSTTGNPAPALSCTNCPNPIFTADSSMFYTVRIWNNDSCSVVVPCILL